VAQSDIGESIVGSYLRHVRDQGEVDVIGIRSSGSEVWLCEVATHICGLQYDKSAQKSRDKLRTKIDRAKQYADGVFASHEQHFEVWSPYVPIGTMTNWMAEERVRRADDKIDVDFIINDRYADAVSELVAVAKATTKTTGEDAFRMLQILTHLRGQVDW
jgi:hypothetical protein